MLNFLLLKILLNLKKANNFKALVFIFDNFKIYCLLQVLFDIFKSLNI